MSRPRYFISPYNNIFQKERFLQCDLCPRRCIIPPGGEGSCKVRVNLGGSPELPFYGFVTALAKDPIEKKPLYHFRPGNEILSAGFAGCNLHCPFCQNWHISQNVSDRNDGISGHRCSPQELIAAAEKSAGKHGAAIAYTYSEPLVHIEFLLDCMMEARKAGVANVLVTNGCVNPEVAEEILELTDAANIDLKCFSEETYSKVLGSGMANQPLAAVLNFIKTAVKNDVHIELTTLVVPGLNDSEKELDACADFIAGLYDNEKAITGKCPIPWHLSAYHPDWKWNAPATKPEHLTETASRARERLAYVYSGNVAGEENDTFCHNCGKSIISRRGYRVDTSGISLKCKNEKPAYFCVFCGEQTPIRF